MRELIESGAVVPLILCLVLLEALVLTAYRLRTGRGVPVRALLLNLGAGASLLLALRAVQLRQHWAWVAAWLLSALLCHLGDLRSRWQRPAASSPAPRPRR